MVEFAKRRIEIAGLASAIATVLILPCSCAAFGESIMSAIEKERVHSHILDARKALQIEVYPDTSRIFTTG